LRERVCFNETVLKWIQHSKRNKKSVFYEAEELFTHLQYIQNGVIFWCHPNYKSNGEWYDWVMVKFDMGTHRTSRHKNNAGYWSDQYFPSKIMCFFRIPDDDMIYAIVQSTTTNNHNNDSILFEKWQLEMSIHVERNGKKQSNLSFMLWMLIALVIHYL